MLIWNYENFFLPEKCKEYSEVLFNERGFKDLQCPLSISFYGKFDFLLEEKLELMENLTQVKLFPCISYARLYKKNEILKSHTDRPKLDYTVSVTLDNDGSFDWPIYIDGIQYSTKIGEGLIINGNKISHWRNQFLGEWQTQLMLHYTINPEYKFEKKS